MAGDTPTTLLEERFADWWRPFAVDLDGARLVRRREGVEALRQALSQANVLDAVAYAHGHRGAGERFIDTVREAGRSGDAAFGGSVGDAEPPALVAAALADQLAIEPDHDLSTLISLLVLSAEYAGLKPAIERMRLAEYAARQIEHRAVTARSAVQLRTRPSVQEQAADALRALEPTPEEPWPDTSAERVRATHATILMALAARIDDLAVGAEQEHRVLREQLRLHTWVMESWCETAEAAWQNVAPEARPMIAAVELAQRTDGITPAADAGALLGSVLTNAGTGLGVDPDAAATAAAAYLEGRLPTPPDPTLFPLTGALARWSEHGEESVAERFSGQRTAADWQDELAVAMQTYREALALRAIAHG